MENEPLVPETLVVGLQTDYVSNHLSDPKERTRFINTMVLHSFSSILHGEQGALNDCEFSAYQLRGRKSGVADEWRTVTGCTGLQSVCTTTCQASGLTSSTAYEFKVMVTCRNDATAKDEELKLGDDWRSALYGYLVIRGVSTSPQETPATDEADEANDSESAEIASVIESLGDSSSTHHATDIGRHDREIGVFCDHRVIFQHAWAGINIINWHSEEALNLIGMKINGDHADNSD